MAWVWGQSGVPSYPHLTSSPAPPAATCPSERHRCVQLTTRNFPARTAGRVLAKLELERSSATASPTSAVEEGRRRRTGCFPVQNSKMGRKRRKHLSATHSLHLQKLARGPAKGVLARGRAPFYICALSTSFESPCYPQSTGGGGSVESPGAAVAVAVCQLQVAPNPGHTPLAPHAMPCLGA